LELARSCRALGDEAQARTWLEEAARFAREEVAFDPASGYYCLGQALMALGDAPGVIQAYQAALDHHCFYPERQEVEDTLARLRGSA
jgi:FimV-like protein